MTMNNSGKYCVGFEEVLGAYNKITPKVVLSGPTNFAPAINKVNSIGFYFRIYLIYYLFYN